ncbi:MAG TPA: M2 family metallopeptidase, partial [Verrucomicrobiae bacterium]
MNLPLKSVTIATLACLHIVPTLPAAEARPVQEATTFLETYNHTYQRLYAVSQEAQWLALTDVTDEHTGQRIGADRALAAFVGSPWVIEKTRALLQQTNQLDNLTVRQLRAILLN